jgi:hypothetical protein
MSAFDDAWAVLKATPRRRTGGTSSRAPPRTMRFGKVRQQRPAPKPRNISVPIGEQQAKPVPFNPNDLPVAPEEPIIGDPTMPYGKPMIPGDARMDMNATMPPYDQEEPDEGESGVQFRRRIREMEQNIHPTMDKPGSIDIPPEERDKYLTMRPTSSQGFYPEVRTGEPMVDAWSEILKRLVPTSPDDPMGTKLIDSMFCQQCKQGIGPKDPKCERCGAPNPMMGEGQ